MNPSLIKVNPPRGEFELSAHWITNATRPPESPDSIQTELMHQIVLIRNVKLIRVFDITLHVWYRGRP